ncbi:hypothetical protein ACLB2K_075963 [Fragaria x ananassa]
MSCCKAGKNYGRKVRLREKRERYRYGLSGVRFCLFGDFLVLTLASLDLVNDVSVRQRVKQILIMEIESVLRVGGLGRRDEPICSSLRKQTHHGNLTRTAERAWSIVNLSVKLVPLDPIFGVWDVVPVAVADTTPSQCKEEKKLWVDACKAVATGSNPSPYCCQRLRVTHLECVCPYITPC